MPLHKYLDERQAHYFAEAMMLPEDKRSTYERQITRQRSAMVAQLFEAINFLSTEKVAHRDLKSDNILVEMDISGIFSIFKIK